MYSQELALSNKNLPCLNKHYNVFVHISVDSLGNANFSPDQIQSLFDDVNDAFAPICVSFGICKVDTFYNYKFDIINAADGGIEVTEMINLFGQDNRVNLYLYSGWYPPSNCGFAIGGINSQKDGDIILLKYCGRLTLIHELGHMFGLKDTYGSRTELVDGSNCETAEDEICDTPADPYKFPDLLGNYISEKCSFIYTEEKDPNGDWYQPDTGNYMGPYYGCRCGFTRGQYLKMVETYHNSDLKNW